MKKLLSTLAILTLALVCIFVLPTRADAASESDLTFTLNADGESYSVTDCKGSASGELTIPSTYNGKLVTTIGSYAFSNCKSLSSVTIPDSVTTIGEDAFYFCTSLTSVTIPDSVTTIGSYAFQNCTSLTSITIGNSVTSIGNYAFDNCYRLTSVTIGKSVTTIGSSAFQNCTNLTSITIPDSVTTIGSYAFYNCTGLTSITIPDSVTTIGYEAFYYCTSLTSITIPDSVTSIGSYAFAYCYDLTSVTIGNSVTTIGSYAFYSCYGLTSVTISDGVTSIGTNAFYGCSIKKLIVADGSKTVNSRMVVCRATLEEVVIPNSVTSISDGAFECCERLTTIVIPDSVITIDNGAFYESSLTTITIGSGVTTIGDGAFAYCELLTTVNIPDSVNTMGNDVFSYCISLTSINIPDSVTTIGSSAFKSCTSLTSVTIPDSVTTIGNYAFYNCTSLTDVWYGSVETAKNKISISSSNYPLLNASWHYSSCNHRYTDVCDATCNLCDKERTAPHEGFEWVVDKQATCGVAGTKHEECTACGAKRNTNTTIAATGKHVYTDACDAQCNVCKSTRTPPHGTYKWVVDKQETCGATGTKHEECTGCGAKRNTKTTIAATGNHTYSYTCSRKCKVCSASNPNPASHTYSYTCSRKCKVCSASNPNPASHTYTGSYDTKCNTCSATRSLSEKDVTLNNLTYHVIPDENGGTATLTAVSKSLSGKVTVPSKVNGAAVVAVAGYAFENCKYVTGIVIPNSVTSIGNCAFSGCTGLYELQLPFLDRTFAYLFGTVVYGDVSKQNVPLSLKKVTINSGKIPNYSFKNCDDISTVVLGDKVTEVGSYAFAECNSITTLTVGKAAELIGVGAFENCESLTKVTIGAGTKIIDESAFRNCVSLSTITVGSNVTIIGDYAFQNCISLETFTLPANLEQIGNYAFDYCISLTKIVIPNKVKLIGYYAFQNCVAMSSATIGTSVNTIFGGAFMYCSSLKKIVLPSSTTSIGESTFAYCTSLNLAVFRGRTDHINNRMFEGCSKLTVVAFPKNVDTIAYNAFSGCDKLKDVWFEGTKTQKNNMVIAGGNTTVKKATWHYGEFDPAGHVYTNACDTSCNICGTTRTAPHSYAAATCTKAKTCKLCGKTSGSSLGHNYVSNKCTRCSKVKLGYLTQPTNAAAPKGKTAKVTVKATGEGLSYTWYYKNKGASSFSKSSTTTNTYSATMDSTRNGRQVYCVIKDKTGATVKSNVVTLYMGNPAKITKQPTNVNVVSGATAKTSVTATGDGLTYTWYYKNKDASSYSKSSITTKTYSMTMDSTRNGRQVYCVVKDKYGTSVKTNVVTLTMKKTAKITKQPANVTVANGAQAKTSITATGDGLTYTWYFKNKGASSYSKSSITTNTYTATMDSTRNGRQVYCVVKDKYGNSVKSNVVTLSMKSGAKITKQPVSVTVSKNATAKVSVTASGDGLTYTWYFKNKTASTYSKSSITTNTYTMTMDATRNGRQVYCVVKDKYGNSVKSNVVTLNMK